MTELEHIVLEGALLESEKALLLVSLGIAGEEESSRTVDDPEHDAPAVPPAPGSHRLLIGIEDLDRGSFPRKVVQPVAAPDLAPGHPVERQGLVETLEAVGAAASPVVIERADRHGADDALHAAVVVE